MAARLSTGLVKQLMDTGSFKSIFDNAGGGGSAGCLINVYTGVQPTTADDAATGTLLVTISVSGGGTGMTFEATATAGELEKNSGETWQGTAAATGTAGWFRLYRKADSASAQSTTSPRFDGNISTSNAEMNLGSLAVTSGAPFILTAAAFTLPQS